MGFAGDIFRAFSKVRAPSLPSGEWPKVTPGTRVLVSRADHLGDLVMALPVIRSLAAAGAAVDLLLKRPYAPLVVGQPGIRNVFPHTLPWQDPHGRGDGWHATFSLRRRLQDNYDLVLELTEDLLSMALLSSAGTGVGWDVPGARAWLRFVACPEEAHQVDRCLALARRLGGEEVPAAPYLEVAPGAPSRVEALLGAPLADRTVLVHPGAAGPAKAWPRDRFAGLASALAANGIIPLFLAGPGESTERFSTGRVIQPSLPELVDLAHVCGIFVGNDSGPAHVAAAAGASTITIFGPTMPLRTGPYSSRSRIVSSGLSCQPCWAPRTPFHCATARECLNELAIEEVLRAVQGTLATVRHSPA